tara:strand:+ start:11659 stop:12282 length:624 start_codon:yes stop_codon:yes gene_type:complete
MKFVKVILSLSILLAFSLGVTAQTEEVKPSLNAGSIDSQFDYLYKKSPKWEDYRSVKTNLLFKFKANVSDSLKLGRTKLKEANATILTQKNEIETLKADLSKTNDNLSSVTEEKDKISLLGIPLSKTGYNTILWSIIAALTAFLVLFIGRFKQSNTVTVEAKKTKSEIEEEFENYRQRSIEREQKLRRELQDELNKQKYAKQEAKKK